MTRSTVIGKTFVAIAVSVIGNAQTAVAQAPGTQRAGTPVAVTGPAEQDTVVFVSNAAPIIPFGGRFDIIGGAGIVPGMVVTGKPYSAAAVTESTQMLTDGNRITQRNEMRIFRDWQGRTRREQTLTGLGVWQAANEPTTTITIHDPVAGTTYMLNPATETAHAIRPFGLHTASAIRVVGDEVAVAYGDGAQGAPVPPQAQTFELPVPPPPGGSPPTAGVRVFSSAGAVSAMPFAPGEVTTEDLGEQILQGVRALGSRETRTIPAGTIGNERPIDMVTERWYSEEIDADVLRRHVDPRFGETEYRLINLVLGEPAPDLFVVPEGYELAAEESPRFEFKLQQPEPGSAVAPE